MQLSVYLLVSSLIVISCVIGSERSFYCNECSIFSISSSGPAQSVQPNSFGSYAVVGSFWENFLPYYKNALTGLYLTLHPNASPEISYVPWVVSENPVDAIGDLSHVTLKTQDREGIICPWDSHGALTWEFKTREGGWEVDHTIRVECLS